MSRDVYQLCPCGSGNKLKFCCNEVADDMEKILRQQENGQPTQALRGIEKLEQKPGLKPQTRDWVLSTKSILLLADSRPADALAASRQLLEHQPDHELGLALRAAAAYAVGDYRSAREEIQASFEHCWQAQPELVSTLALSISQEMFDKTCWMSCREHMALAMRTANPEARQQVFMLLLQQDSDSNIPYPFRSVHQLQDYRADAPETDERRAQGEQAVMYANLGCWPRAAETYRQLLEQDADNAALWQNLGLCQVWSAEETAGAESLHRAAELFADAGQALECETLAQLLDLKNTAEQARIVTRAWDVNPLSTLLSRLEKQPRLLSRELPRRTSDDDPAEYAVAMFDIVAGPMPEYAGELTLSSVQTVQGQLGIYDANIAAGTPARAYLTGFDDESLEQAQALFLEIAGDAATRAEAADESDDGESLPCELLSIYWRWRYPDQSPMFQRRELERQQWRRALGELWPNAPLGGLGGKTPREAAGDPALRGKLLAAIYVLDAYCDRNRHHLDLAGQCRDLNVEPLPPLEVNEETWLQSFSSLQMSRLPVEKLSDSQLSACFNRALLIHHHRFLYAVLLELLKRPACQEHTDMGKVYQGLMELAREQYRPEEALNWIEQGKTLAREQENSFEALFGWELRELTQRLENLQDPLLPGLINRFWNFYGSKLPATRPYLLQMLESLKLPPEDKARLMPTGSQTAASALWTPDSAAADSPGVSKLWTPGED